MASHISISNNKQNNCDFILKKLLKSKINCRIIETKSVVDDNIENGCLITFDQKYSSKKEISNIWKIIKDDYTCSHLKIDGIFDGCIFNYLIPDNCPG